MKHAQLTLFEGPYVTRERAAVLFKWLREGLQKHFEKTACDK